MNKKQPSAVHRGTEQGRKSGILVLIDGQCGLCNRLLQLLLRVDKKGVCLFASQQSEVGEHVQRLYFADNVRPDSIVVIDGGQPYLFSDALLRIALRLGGGYRLAYALVIIPKLLRDALYRSIARNRKRFFAEQEECKLPSEQRRKQYEEQFISTLTKYEQLFETGRMHNL